ncbi:glutathione S-transferase N-terminal domain-containing protein [Bradyrhizobium diazoefficiens]|nr:glutathione S-transferase N-terminal domain-containing protein [Bradyrhizobium diazoefficiens]
MAELEIMGVPFSNYVRSIRMLCEEKGVTYKLTPSRPQSPEVKAIHPAGQIPVMRHGDVTLFESKAIATYIAHFLARSSSRTTRWKQPRSSNGFRTETSRSIAGSCASSSFRQHFSTRRRARIRPASRPRCPRSTNAARRWTTALRRPVTSSARG